MQAASSGLAGLRLFIMEVRSRLPCWCAVSRNPVRFSLQEKETGPSPMLLLLCKSTPTVPRACAQTETDQLSALLFYSPLLQQFTTLIFPSNRFWILILYQQIWWMGVPTFNSIVYVVALVRLASKLSSESDDIQTFLPERESIRIANCQLMIQFHYYFKVSRYAKVRLTIPLPRQWEKPRPRTL